MKKRKAYRNGFFKVTNGHSLYYEFYGNPQGIPVVYFHGGPGAGFNDSAKEFFDPRKYNVLLFDQRGAGRSKPFASIKNNTTQKLVKDTEKLLDFAGFDKALLFGGSWGSTLALCFAIKFPQRVSGMILRGIYLSNKEANDFFLEGAGLFYPEALEKVRSLVPKGQQKKMIDFYFMKMQSKDSKIRKKFAKEWANYEHSLLQLDPKNAKSSQINSWLNSKTTITLSVLETHFIRKNCFIPEDYILKNAHKIPDVPISIIHGRYDMICPPNQAYALHKKIPNSNLHFVVAGHWSQEPEIKKKLKSELRKFDAFLGVKKSTTC